VLEIVEHHGAARRVAQVPDEILRDGGATRRRRQEPAARGSRDQTGILERRETDEDDTVGEIVEQLGRHLDGEPRLPVPPCRWST